MHLINYVNIIATLLAPCFAFTINWDGSQPRCRLSQGRIQTIYNTIDSEMSADALFSQGQTFACSSLGWNGLRYGNTQWGYCAWVGNGGGNSFNKAKILSMLGYLLEPPNSGQSCGSVPIDYPLLNNSYNALTVNYVYGIPCSGVCVNSQDPQNTLPNNPDGYASGTCKINFMQYQNFTGLGNQGDFLDASKPATTHMDVQIVDANQHLIGETWFQESDPSQTWDLPSKLPDMVLISMGAVQSDAIGFAYNGAEFSTSNGCSLSNSNFANGVRYGSCNFQC